MGQNFFWPGKMIKVAVGGAESDLYEEYAESVAMGVARGTVAGASVVPEHGPGHPAADDSGQR